MPEQLLAAQYPAGRGAGRRGALLYDRWGYGGSDPRTSFKPGFMESEVPVLLAVCDRFDLPEVDLVGHSDGATIALLFAAQHPERVKSVVSIAAHTFVEPETRAAIRALCTASASAGPPAWLRRLHGDRAASLLDAWARVWLSRAHALWDIRRTLPRVRCPVLAIQGDADSFGTIAQLESIGTAIRGARIRALPGVGHVPHVEATAELIREVVEFACRR